VITTTLVAQCLLLVDSAQFSAWLHHKIFSLATPDHVDISQPFDQGELLLGDSHNGKVYISQGHLQDTMKILSMCIAYLNHFAACHPQPEPGILR